MDFPKFQRLVEERSGFRTMENPTASGEYFSDSCGDMYNFFLKVGPGAVIEDISYFTTGCGFGTATCSLVVDLARGKTVDGAAAITTEQVEAQLDGYPEKKKDYPQRAL
jgi:NifU-like protein involved in Fe-S cluster formation